MALLENDYRAAAIAELERDVRRIEEKDKIAQTKEEIREDTTGIQTNIEFAQRLNLITQQQAEAYKKRVREAVGFNDLMRREMEDITDDFENPRERVKRFQNMDEVMGEIRREKEYDRNCSTTNGTAHTVPSEDERVRG